jgi:hypothetical protein
MTVWPVDRFTRLKFVSSNPCVCVALHVEASIILLKYKLKLHMVPLCSFSMVNFLY